LPKGAVILALDELLRQHQRIVLHRCLVGRAQVGRTRHLGGADAGTLARRLDEERQAQFGGHRVPVGVGLEDVPGRRRQMLGVPHHLGAPLVHRQRRGHHAAAGVRDAHQFQRALHGAVLAEAAVQRDEHAVEALGLQRPQGALPDRRHARPRPSRETPPARVAHDSEISRSREGRHQNRHFPNSLTASRR
jgi:hypothetical protein